MKQTCSFILISLSIILSCINAKSVNQLNDVSSLDPAVLNKIAEIISLSVATRIQEKHVHLRDNKIPVIPELPDPLEFDGHLEFLPDSPLSSLVVGEANFCESFAYGLSSVKDNFTIAPVGPEVQGNYRVDAASISVFGVHAIALNFFDSSMLSGFGVYNVDLKNAFFGIQANLEVNIVTENITLRNLVLDAGFESFSINADESSLNGVNINWDKFNREIKENFELIWGEIKTTLEELLPFAFNLLLKECTISDLINGRFECIGGSKMEPSKALDKELRSIMSVGINDINLCKNMATVTPPSAGTTETGETSTDAGNTDESAATTVENTETTTSGSTGQSDATTVGTTGASDTTTTGAGGTSPSGTTEDSEVSPTTSEPPTATDSVGGIFNNFYHILLVLPIFYFIL